MNRYLIAIIAVLVWSIALAIGSYQYGKSRQADANGAAQTVVVTKGADTLQKRNEAGTDAGIRAATVEAKTNKTFAKIRSEHENNQRHSTVAGCVLDADGLRIWNAANTATEPAAAAAGEPDDTGQPAVDSDAGTGPGE